jgi:hypothetical protein
MSNESDGNFELTVTKIEKSDRPLTLAAFEKEFNAAYRAQKSWESQEDDDSSPSASIDFDRTKPEMFFFDWSDGQGKGGFITVHFSSIKKIK